MDSFENDPEHGAGNGRANGQPFAAAAAPGYDPGAEGGSSQRSGKSDLSAGEEDITQLLGSASAGDPAAVERLYRLLYDDLRRRAYRAMRGAPPDHVLQPTALVHEAYCRLVNKPREWQNRGHFFAVAASAMRCILIDHARRSNRAPARVPLQEFFAACESDVPDLAAFAEAIADLAGRDPRTAQVFDLHYFAGLDVTEIAEHLQLSAKTVYREISLAKSLITQALSSD